MSTQEPRRCPDCRHGETEPKPERCEACLELAGGDFSQFEADHPAPELPALKGGSLLVIVGVSLADSLPLARDIARSAGPHRVVDASMLDAPYNSEYLIPATNCLIVVGTPSKRGFKALQDLALGGQVLVHRRHDPHTTFSAPKVILCAESLEALQESIAPPEIVLVKLAALGGQVVPQQ